MSTDNEKTGTGRTFNMLDLQAAPDYTTDVQTVNPGSMLSAILPPGSAVSSPRSGDITNFGSTVMRSPSEREIELGMDPDSFVVGTVFDYRPILPEEAPDTEARLGLDGPPTSGDPATGCPAESSSSVVAPILNWAVHETFLGGAPNVGSSIGQGLSSAITQATDWAVDAWRGLDPTAKKTLGTAAAVAAAFPLLKAGIKGAGKTAPIALAMRSMGSGNTAFDAAMISEGSALQQVRSGGSLMTPEEAKMFSDSTDVFCIPVGFWKACIELGRMFDQRSEMIPWEQAAGVFASDPMSFGMVGAPLTYISDDGELVRSAVPYIAPYLAGGLWDKIKGTVKKVGKAVLNSPITKMAASVIPGGGAALEVARKVANPLLDRIDTTPKPEQSAAVDVTPLATTALNVMSSTNAVPTVVTNPGVQVHPQALPISHGKVSWTDVVTEGGVVDAMPAEWQTTVEAIGLPSNQEERIREVVATYDLPLEGAAPIIAALAPVLKQVAIWTAFSAAPKVLAKASELFTGSKTEVSTGQQLTADAAGMIVAKKAAGRTPAVTPLATTPKSGFVSALTKASSWLKGGAKFLLRNPKLAGLVAASGLVLALWKKGLDNPGRLASAIENALPEAAKGEWKQLASYVNGNKATELKGEAAQDFIALVMVAVTEAFAREQSGLASEDDKYVLSEGRKLLSLMETNNPEDTAAATQVAAEWLSKLPYDESSEVAYTSTMGNSRDITDVLASMDSGEIPSASYEKDVAELTVERVQQLIDENPDIEGAVYKAASEAETPGQFAKLLKTYGVPVALIASLVALWNTKRVADGKSSVFSSEFWNNGWNQAKQQIQLLPLFKSVNLMSVGVDLGSLF